MTDEANNSVEKKQGIDTASEKSIQFHSALYNGWIQTRMEKDRALLTLAGGAIALLVSMLTAKQGIETTQFLLAAFAIIAFIVSLFSLIAIFHLNAEHLLAVTKNREKSNSFLRSLDTVAITSFVVGVILSFIMGISIGYDQIISKKGGIMNSREDSQTQSDFGRRSLDGISEMDPANSSDPSTSGADSSSNTQDSSGSSSGNSGGN
jgi:TctA family transporter